MKLINVVRTANLQGNVYACEILTDDRMGTGKFVYITTSLKIPPLTEFSLSIPE